jgi:8-oxo-dGTP pyrophosphatase MutT (NUDIX family)
MASKKTVKAAEVEMVDVVDKDDNVVRQVSREEAQAKGLRYRTVHVLLINEDDTMLVQWRAAGKETSPRTFTASAAGVVLAGESYEDAAARELKEEVGAKGVALKRMGDFKVTGERPQNGVLFAGAWDGEPKGWEAEADALDYLNRDEAEYLLKRYPYLLANGFRVSLKLFLKLTK